MPHTAPPALAAFLQSLPKTETHLHLEGALPWELRASLDPAYGLKPPVSWDDRFRFPSFKAFLDVLIGHYHEWYTSAERYAQSARLVFLRQREQNVRYLEFSIDAWTIWNQGMDLREVIGAILEQTPEELVARLFVGLHRAGHSSELQDLAWACLDWPEVSGLDIHDVETKPFAEWLVDLYSAARSKGKCLKAHAGEFGDAGYVREAVRRLSVDRIEHGIRAVEDTGTVALLREREITLDICPISNVKLRASGEMSTHPIRRLFDAGVRCTVSTDDPLVFGNRVSDEYVALALDLGFSRKELIQVARNGWEAALLDSATRHGFLEQLDRLEQALGRED